MDQIKNHQDLLNRFVEAEISNIMERSSAISDDTKDLAIVVNKYAKENDLTVDWEPFAGYEWLDLSFLEQ